MHVSWKNPKMHSNSRQFQHESRLFNVTVKTHGRKPKTHRQQTTLGRNEAASRPTVPHLREPTISVSPTPNSNTHIAHDLADEAEWQDVNEETDQQSRYGFYHLQNKLVPALYFAYNFHLNPMIIGKIDGIAAVQPTYGAVHLEAPAKSPLQGWPKVCHFLLLGN